MEFHKSEVFLLFCDLWFKEKMCTPDANEYQLCNDELFRGFLVPSFLSLDVSFRFYSVTQRKYFCQSVKHCPQKNKHNSPSSTQLC